ncbi:MAG: endolytic transglycosylase MltG [Clostridiales bacterium]|nr:endolytic transglycosylase MltG [Clostridiales bacterium]
MEKLKNILHDYGDVFIAFIIAALMFGVVAWNLGDWFDNDIDIALNNDTDKPVSMENNEQSQVEIINNNSSDISDEEENSSSDTTENNDDIVENNENDQSEDENSNAKGNEIKEITIPSGSPGTAIANILYENGLISDTQTFIETIEALNMASKLKSGAFQIPVNSSVKEIIDIITKSN